MKIVFKTFTGTFQQEKLSKKPHEAPIGMLIAPIVLVSLVVIFGLFPNILSDSLIAPAMAAIIPSLLPENGMFPVHITFWHGFNTELMMTIGVIVIGIAGYKTFPKWRKVYELFPEKLSFNHLYDQSLAMTEQLSSKLTNRYMTGFIRTYLVYIFIFFIVVLTSTLVAKNAFTVSVDDVAPVGIYEIILATMIIISSIMILFTKSRVASILLLGSIGYTVALFFVLFRAPDLALTQLVIETISVALFLLCFYHLPKMNRKIENRRFKLTNALISIGVGALVTIIALSAHSSKVFESISQFYVENTYERAAGKNMVNVILVDFRGFDTMFEILVLAIAGLGIYGMIKLRLARRKEER